VGIQSHWVAIIFNVDQIDHAVTVNIGKLEQIMDARRDLSTVYQAERLQTG
jgi:hypothetical protein